MTDETMYTVQIKFYFLNSTEQILQNDKKIKHEHTFAPTNA